MRTIDWTATLNEMRETLSPTHFQTWISPVQFLRSDEKSITISVPSQFHGDWISKRYGQKLREAIRRQTGNELQLEFEVFAKENNAESTEILETPPETNLETAPPARPTLRVVPTIPQEKEVSERAERPSLPSYPSQLLEFDFNRVANQCAQLFIDGSQWHLKTLVVVGGVGMGKTHLLADVGKTLYFKNPKLRIRYVNAESFTNELVMSYKNETNREFKQKYQLETDVLLFDDLHHLKARTKTQEQILHIFNEITGRGGRVLFTSALPIPRLEEFIEPLKSRLMSCVLAEIKFPTFQERAELLGKTALQNQISIDGETIRALADHGQRDVRELVSSLLRMHLQAGLEGRQLNVSYLAQEGWVRERERAVISIEEIVSLVEHNYGVSRDELNSKSRKSATAWARQVAMYLCRRFTQNSLQQIGSVFERDHATTSYACDKVAEAIKEQPTRQYEVEFLVKKLEARTNTQSETDSQLE